MAHPRRRRRSEGGRLGRLLLWLGLVQLMLVALVTAGAGHLATVVSNPMGGGRRWAAVAGKYAPLVQEAAAETGLDPELIAAVAQAESGFNLAAVSARGARGLMQLLPVTWQELNPNAICRGDHAPPAREPDCIYDPAANLKAGARYLRRLLVEFKSDPLLALAAYNAGPAEVRRQAGAGRPGGVPPYPETQRYTRRVLDAWTFQRAGMGRVELNLVGTGLAVLRWGALAQLALLAFYLWSQPDNGIQRRRW